MEFEQHRKRRNRIWLALLCLGVIIQANLLLTHSSPVHSAASLVSPVSNKEATSSDLEKKSLPEKEKPENPSAIKEEGKSPAGVDNPLQNPASPADHATILPAGKMISKIPLVQKTVYLTFDDGPGKYTQQMVDILNKNQIQGAFFWIGKNLKDKDIPIAKQMLSSGHVIGTHTMYHEKLRQKPKQVQVKMIQDSTRYTSQKIGAPIYYFRPPYGAVDANTLAASKETNQILAYWNVDSLDWKYPHNPGLVLKNIETEVKPGSIILLHEKEQTVQLLPQIINLLKKKGYAFAPLPTPAPPVKKS
ncbi:polysaccharide deacetylase family protein [Aneurinibacillus tyrosinisolvens]|uniref:polysaccharide deacetylase family protein n=1 Tax=Aneurinibacillus tyrosinisolvens TaxID=1443435 RepID=UPI00069C1129|nr:polysaccharide deacetylase family protein [Aneurinibacillus tyrosinisolvens]